MRVHLEHTKPGQLPNKSMREHYAEFEKLNNKEIPALVVKLRKVLGQLPKTSGNTTTQQAAAFYLQNYATQLVNRLETYRDLMPLVNVIGRRETRGAEPEAKAFLATGKPSGGIESVDQAMWALFDFAAIDDLHGVNLKAMGQSIRDSLPWVDTAQLWNLWRKWVAENKLKSGKPTPADFIAGLMLANHLRLVRLSYPKYAKFGSFESVGSALQAEDSPVNRTVVAEMTVMLAGSG